VPLIFLGLSLRRPSPLPRNPSSRRDRRDRLGLGLAHDRRDQPPGIATRPTSNACAQHAAIGPAALAFGNPLQRDRQRLDDKSLTESL